jgi:hypothetical protein
MKFLYVSCLDILICMSFATPEGGMHIYIYITDTYNVQMLWLRWICMCMFSSVSLDHAHIQTTKTTCFRGFDYLQCLLHQAQNV